MPELAATSRSKRDNLRRFYIRWLALGLGLTAMANLAVSFFLPPGARAIRPHAEGSLTHIAHTEQDTVDQRFAFYLELDDATNPGVLVVPVGSFVIPELADGFANLEVIERDYDPTELVLDGPQVEPTLGFVEVDEDGTLLPYFIVTGDDDTWWLAETEEGIVVVPESVGPGTRGRPMTAEVMIGALLAASGFGVLAPVMRDVTGAARLWLSIPTGVAVYLQTSLVLIILTGTLSPALALGITVGLGVAGLGVGLAMSKLDRGAIGWAVSAIGIAVVTVVLARIWHLTRLTPDSLRYLLAATDLVRADALAEINDADLLIRQIGLPSLQAFYGLVGRDYVASIAPLFGVSGFGLFTWFSWQVTDGMDLRKRQWLVVAAVLFLGTANRLVYDAFYINSHIQMAVFVLIAIVGSWLAVSRGQIGWAWPAGLALAATLLLRPESPLVVAVVLITIGASRATWPARLATTLPPVFVMSLWYGVVLWQNAIKGDVISLQAPVFGSLVAVFGAALVVVIGGFEGAKRWIGYTDRVALAGLALLIMFFAARTPEILVRSLESTFRNLTYNGLWLFTWLAAIGLLAVALWVHRIPDSRLWTIPMLGFGLLFFLLPLIRGGAWRVGTGDSGNRILAHILGVVVAFLVLAAVESPAQERS